MQVRECILGKRPINSRDFLRRARKEKDRSSSPRSCFTFCRPRRGRKEKRAHKTVGASPRRLAAGAGDGIRTRDIQLGKLNIITKKWLNHAGSSHLMSTHCPLLQINYAWVFLSFGAIRLLFALFIFSLASDNADSDRWVYLMVISAVACPMRY